MLHGSFSCWQTPTLITIKMYRNKRTNARKKAYRLGSNRCNITALKTFKSRSLKKLNAIHLRLVRVVGSRLQHIHHIVLCAHLPHSLTPIVELAVFIDVAVTIDIYRLFE